MSFGFTIWSGMAALGGVYLSGLPLPLGLPTATRVFALAPAWLPGCCYAVAVLCFLAAAARYVAWRIKDAHSEPAHRVLSGQQQVCVEWARWAAGMQQMHARLPKCMHGMRTFHVTPPPPPPNRRTLQPRLSNRDWYQHRRLGHWA